MKNWLLFLLGLTLIAFSCRPDQAVSAATDPLYRRWKLVEQTPSGGSPRAITATDITEFLPDGTIRYENQTFLCCTPVKVARQGQTLTPVHYGDGKGCERVDCAPPTELRILQLTDKVLLIEAVRPYMPNLNYTNRYEAVN